MHFHWGARLQSFLPVHHHLIAYRNAAGNQGDISLRQIHFDGLHVRLAGLYGIDVGALRPALNRRERHHDGILANGQHQSSINELIRPERQILILKSRFESNRPRGGIDLVVHRQKLARCNLALIVAAISLHAQLLAFHVLNDFREVVFRQCEKNRNRLHLRDDHQAVRIRGMNHVALIDEPQPHASAEWRGNLAINQLQFFVVDLGLVGAHGPFHLPHRGVLRIHLLRSDDALFRQLVVTLEIDSGIVQRRLIAEELPFHLFERHLEGSRIDLGQEIAFVHELPLLEIDLLQFAIHAALYRNRVKRRHRPKAREIVGYVLLQGRRDRYRDGAECGCFGAGRGRGLALGGRARFVIVVSAAGQHDEQENPHPAALFRLAGFAAGKMQVRFTLRIVL